MGADVFGSKADLRDQVQDFMADEFDARELDRAIGLCETNIRNRLRTLDMEVTTDLALTGETLVVPSRFLAARRLYIPGNVPMQYVEPGKVIEFQVQRDRGLPEFYTLEGVEDALPIFRFAPIPDSPDYILRLTYLADGSLVGDDDCNNILEDAPDIYFYGTVYHMIPYVRNAERFGDIRSLYEQAMTAKERSDIRDKIDGGRLIARPSQVPA